MKITPINTTTFKGFGAAEMQQITKYAIEKQKGSMYDLGKRFSPDLINVLSTSGKIHIDRALQNWQADKFFKEIPSAGEKTISQQIAEDKKALYLMKRKGKINF